MGDVPESQLEAMGLCPIRENQDQRLGYGKWAERRTFHAHIKSVVNTQSDKPKSTDMWRYEAGNNLLTAVRCNMGIHIVKLNAIIPEGNTNGSDKALPDEYHLCKKETGIWSKKYLTSAEGPHQRNQHLTQASNSDNYSVREYNNYVPKQVMDAVDTYKTLLYNKHVLTETTLTMDMITPTFISFKCDYQMDEEDMINDHVYDVHNVSGISAMKPVQG